MAKRARTEKGNEDLISQLPEHLKHHILYRLPMREAMKTSMLSRSWRDEWLKLRCLSLSKSLFSKLIKRRPESDPDSLSREFLTFVGRVLTKRCDPENYRSMTVLKLHVPGFSCKNPETVLQVNWWIRCAFNQLRVKQLEFSVEYAEREPDMFYELPLSCMDLGQQKLARLKLTRCNLDLPIQTRWMSLKVLDFHLVVLNQELLDSITTECPLLQKLQLRECEGQFDSLNASCLKRLAGVSIKWCKAFKRIVIDSPNLEDFEYDHDMKSTGELCKIDLSAGKKLVRLIIHSARITNHWLSRNLSRQSKLKRVCLQECDHVKQVKISSSCLECMQVTKCAKLAYMNIDAPKLEKFWYIIREDRRFPPFRLNALALKIARVDFHLNWPWEVDVSWFEEMTNFFKKLNITETFEVRGRISTMGKALMIPQNLREIFTSPLHRVKHLVAGCWQPSDQYESLVDIINALLWLSTHPETICIKSIKPLDKHLKELILLKFKYKEDDSATEKCGDCVSLHVQCWKHSLQQVTVQNSGGLGRTPARDQLDNELKSFFENVRRVEKIIVDVVDI